jgi:crossover junction endodeoxyribonuclease RuvC
LRILGIDPGYAILGYGVVDYDGNKYMLVSSGVITTEADTEMSLRLKLVYDGLSDVISLFKPEVASIEELFFNNNAKTAIKVGEGRGVAILACVNADIPVFEYTPLQIKQALSGYGRAGKEQIQGIVKSILGLDEVLRPDDAADAAAAAICHGNSAGYIDRFANARSF